MDLDSEAAQGINVNGADEAGADDRRTGLASR
jgi:hypothetical protein